MLKKKEKQHRAANEKAITLIALVVTIVILLILSVVSIAILTGKNGVINQAKGVKEKYEQSGSKEEIELNELSKELKNDIKRKGTLEVIETTEDSLKVKMSTDNASKYQFSLDGNNWTDSQKQNEYIFTGLDKVIANANNYKEVSGKEYKIYSKVTFTDGNEIVYGPKVVKTKVEAVSDKEYEYIDLGNEICVTSLKTEGFVENPSSMEELDNKIKELQIANVIPSYINGKPVTKIYSKLLEQKTNSNITDGDCKIYVYYKESSDATATKIYESTVSSFIHAEGKREAIINLKGATFKSGYYKIYGFYDNSYGVIETKHDETSDTQVILDIKNNSNALVLPPTLKEIIDSKGNNIATLKEITKVASLNNVRSGKTIGGYGKIEIFINKYYQPETTNIAFLGRADNSDIKNISVFDKVMSKAKQKVIEYYN